MSRGDDDGYDRDDNDDDKPYNALLSRLINVIHLFLLSNPPKKSMDVGGQLQAKVLQEDVVIGALDKGYNRLFFSPLDDEDSVALIEKYNSPLPQNSRIQIVQVENVMIGCPLESALVWMYSGRFQKESSK